MPDAALGPCIDSVVPILGDIAVPQAFLWIAGFGLSFLAIASALLQLVQSRMMLPVADPTNDDPNVRIQRQTMLFLPLISVVYGGFLPAGLFIYWIVATVFSIVQQYLIVGWGAMFPLLRADASLRGRPHPALPGGDATPTRASQACGHPDRRRQEDDGHQDDPPPRAGPSGPTRETTLTMSAYKEFSGKSVEDALRAAREEFGAELNDLDFEILTPGSRGVLGMGAEPARIVAAPRQALGGAAPKRDAAASVPLPRRRARPPRPRPPTSPR